MAVPQQGQYSASAMQTQGQGNPQQEFRKGMMATSAGFFASAAAEAIGGDTSVMAPIQQMGVNIADAMQQRWWEKEWKDFKGSIGKQYEEASLGLVNDMKKKEQDINMGIWVNEDGSAFQLDNTTPEGQMQIRALLDNMHKETMTQFAYLSNQYMEEAQKYRNNPMVEKSVKTLLMNTSQGIKDLLGPSVATRNAQETANVADTEAATRLKDAQARQADAAAQNLAKGEKEKIPWQERVQEAVGSGNLNAAMNILATEPGAQEAAAPAVKAAIQRAVTRQKQAKRITTPDEEKEFVMANGPKFQAIGMADFLDSMYPGAGTALRESVGGERFAEDFDKAGPTQLPLDATAGQKAEYANELVQQSMDRFAEVVTSGEVDEQDYDAVVEAVVKEIVDPQIGPGIADGDTSSKANAIRNRIRQQVVNSLKDRVKVESEIPEVIERLPRKGFFERAGEATRGLLETSGEAARTAAGGAAGLFSATERKGQ